MTTAEQISYLHQQKAKPGQDANAIERIIESLKALQSVAGGSRNDSCIVEMKTDDYKMFQQYKLFKAFEKAGAAAGQRMAEAIKQKLNRKTPSRKFNKLKSC